MIDIRHTLHTVVGILLLFMANAAWTEEDTLAVGWTRAQAIEWLGEPEAQIKNRGRELLYYDHDEVVLAHGVVVEFTPGIRGEADRARARKNRPAPRNVRPAPSAHRTPPPQRAHASSQKTQTIRGKGQRVDLASIVVPGKVTVIDFFADWCGPCRLIAPKVEAMVKSDPDLVLRKIDIVRWKTPVTQQHNIRSVPQLWVFDRAGKQVGKPTSNLKLVQQYVRQAKQ